MVFEFISKIWQFAFCLRTRHQENLSVIVFLPWILTIRSLKLPYVIVLTVFWYASVALFYHLCHILKITELGDLKISLLGKELLPVPSGKDLGVILNNNLTYHDHITKTVSSFFSRLAQINRVQQAFNNKILINIIYT